MKQAIIDAAKPIGGIATSQQLAEFLRVVIPGRVNTIADRLNHYRREITQNEPITPLPPEEEDVLRPSVQSPVGSQQETSETITIPKGRPLEPPKNNQSNQIVYGAIILALAILATGAVWIMNPPPSQVIIEKSKFSHNSNQKHLGNQGR